MNRTDLSVSTLSARTNLAIVMLLITGLVTVLCVSQAYAEENDTDERPEPVLGEKPRWEVGFAGAFISGYDYPASNDPNKRLIGLPYFIYRTPVFRIGDGGIRAVAIERPKLSLDLSISGSLNASSEGNRARDGMPDLDFLFEIGPQLKLQLLDKELPEGGQLQATFAAELRAVLATDFRGIEGQGVVAEAGIGVVRRGYLDDRIALVGLVDITFASEELQDYFYEVAPEYVTAERPLHDARGGYLGASAFLGVGVKASKRVNVFLGGVGGFYAGAANEGSTLHESRESLGYVVGFSWTLATSKHKINVADIEVSRSE